MRFSSSIRILLAAVCLPMVLTTCSDPEPKRSNVILITLDTLRADYLSCYGPSDSNTPNLDGLAQTGVRFSLAHTASAVTPVSHATILTGRLPYEHGLRVLAGGSGYHLDPGQPSIATAFEKAGYRTGAIQSAFPVSRTFGLDQGFEVFKDVDGTFKKGSPAIAAAWDVNRLQRRSDATTDLALEFIDSAEEPFFLWIHYWDPHDTQLLPPAEYMAKQPKRSKRGIPLHKDETAVYAIEVEYQDEQIGRLFQGLRDRNMMEDMVIAATSDHGEGLIDGHQLHGWYNHRMTYQEQLHVPLLLTGPGIPEGVVEDSIVSTADIAPTLLALAGLPPVQGGGINLLPLASADSPAKKRWVYSDQINAFDWNAGLIYKRPDSAFLYTVTDGEWKLTYRPHLPFAASELFNLKLDPKEQHNRIDRNEAEFRVLAENLAARSPWVFEPFVGEGMDEKSRESLANIGYGHLQASGGLQWWWECAVHPETRLENRGRCSQDSKGSTCGFPLLPRTDWKAPELKKK